MRNIIFLCLVAAFAVPAFAGDVQRCHTISSPDARNYCRALVKGDRSICATIEDVGLRARCQAEVG